MALAATILVEGNDIHFVKMYLEHLGFKEKLLTEEKQIKGLQKSQVAGKIDVRTIGGNETKIFGKAFPILKEAINNSDKTLVLLDANSKPKNRRKKFDELAKEKNIDTESLFLFLLPNDENEGALEDLLENISTSTEIYECFDAYEDCLKNKGKKPPNKKARIYAYCDSNGIEPRGNKRDYDKPEYWDLKSKRLNALKAFIQKHLSAPLG